MAHVLLVSSIQREPAMIEQEFSVNDSILAVSVTLGLEWGWSRGREAVGPLGVCDDDAAG